MKQLTENKQKTWPSKTLLSIDNDQVKHLYPFFYPDSKNLDNLDSDLLVATAVTNAMIRTWVLEND